MDVLIVDLSLNQDSYPRFKEIFGDECNSIYFNGFFPPYPKIDAHLPVVLTGSEYSILNDYEWIFPLMDWIVEAYDRGNPILGVCYSHQLIARALVGIEAVSRVDIPEMTFIPIEITKDNPLFKGLDNPFLVMSAHYDQVRVLPEGFESLARSKDCLIQAMAHNSKPVYGIQFHPEIDGETGRKCIYSEKKILIDKGFDIDYLLSQIRDNSTGAEQVLRNFLKIVR
jgi:GMP synthase (glutamine-hydrolysing)